MIDIQGNLKALLDKKGVLQKNVAKELGISEQAVSNWFTRKTDLSFTQVSRICEVAGISIVDAVTYPDEYVPKDTVKPECEECKRKDEIIDNLTELLRRYKQDSKKKKE